MIGRKPSPHSMSVAFTKVLRRYRCSPCRGPACPPASDAINFERECSISSVLRISSWVGYSNGRSGCVAVTRVLPGHLIRSRLPGSSCNSASRGNAPRAARSVSATLNQGANMKSGARDQIEGTAKEIKGRAKQKIARSTGDPQQSSEGKLDEAKGKFQKKTGEIKRDIMRG